MALDPIEIIGGLAIGEGLGGAIADTVEPRLQDFKNQQWQAHQDVPLSPAEAAALSAQAYGGTYDGPGDAASSGIDGERFLALRYLAATAPGTPELLELWRRGRITETLVREGLKKAGLLDEFIDAVLELFTGRLDPAIIATAIQRGIMHDPGFLPVGPPTGVGNVPAFPVSPLDPILEAQAHGIDSDRLFVETAIVGLPLSLQESASAYFRGIITLDDFKRAVAEGNTRNEWGDAALAQARQILTAAEYCELQLRGFLTADQRRALTQMHGMTDADSDRLYNVLGRAPSIRQVYTGLARGGVYDGTPQTIPEPFLTAVQRANIRPEWYSIEYANRYSLPSAFVVRSLLKDGAIDATRGSTILQHEGWPPDLADLVATHYAAPTTTGADPPIKAEQTRLRTATHKSYVAEEIDDSVATAALTAAGVAPTAIPAVLTLWKEERALIRKQLSPTQIRKALNLGIVNPATALPWTQADAEQAMLARGYDLADAQVFLQE